MKQKNKINYLFVTGMIRSGTTLLEKVVNSHENINVLSQPFPLLFRDIKLKFFKKINYPCNNLPLNNLFFEEYYTQTQLNDFLLKYQIEKNDLKKIFMKMQGWSGQATNIKNINKIIDTYKKANLIDTHKYLLQSIVNKNSIFLGSKEVLAEEFIPFYLQNEIKIILIIRDPRDVINSIYTGRGSEYAGENRSILFHLRNWRKSVAIANSHKKNKNILILRYEDFIKNSKLVLDNISSFLSLKRFNAEKLKYEIKDNNGKVWVGNSSFNNKSGIDPNNKEKYKTNLETNIISLIEKVCEPEMRTFNYALDIKNNEIDLAKLTSPIKSKNLNINDEIEDFELKKEQIRLKLLVNKYVNEKYILQSFYSMENYRTLRSNYS